MLSTAALSLVFALGAADVNGAAPTLGDLPPLTIAGAPIAHARRVSGRLALRSDWLDEADRLPRRNAAIRAQTAPASGAPASASPEAASSAPPDASGGAASEEEPDIELLRQRARLTRMHRALGIATEVSLVATEAMGTILAINLQTVFGRGLCTPPMGSTNPGNPCLLGDVGSPGGALTYIHELSSFITVGFYTATGLMALSMPDPEHVHAGNDARGTRIRIHRTLAVAHAVGMVLQPILGILAANPQVLNIQPGTTPQSQQSYLDYQSDMRTVHIFVGYATLAALTAAMIDELIQ